MKTIITNIVVVLVRAITLAHASRSGLDYSQDVLADAVKVAVVLKKDAATVYADIVAMSRLGYTAPQTLKKIASEYVATGKIPAARKLTGCCAVKKAVEKAAPIEKKQEKKAATPVVKKEIAKKAPVVTPTTNKKEMVKVAPAKKATPAPAQVKAAPAEVKKEAQKVSNKAAHLHEVKDDYQAVMNHLVKSGSVSEEIIYFNVDKLEESVADLQGNILIYGIQNGFKKFWFRYQNAELLGAYGPVVDAFVQLAQKSGCDLKMTVASAGKTNEAPRPVRQAPKNTHPRVNIQSQQIAKKAPAKQGFQASCMDAWGQAVSGDDGI